MRTVLGYNVIHESKPQKDISFLMQRFGVSSTCANVLARRIENLDNAQIIQNFLTPKFALEESIV